MRAITLEPRSFSLLWQAYAGTNKQCSMQELGVAARLLTKLKDISKEDKAAAAGRSLKEPESLGVEVSDSAVLFLEEDEWQLMKGFYDTTPWNTMSAIEVIAFKKFLDELPEYKQTPRVMQ